MKTKYWIALLTLTLIGCIAASFLLLFPGKEAARAEIRSEGKVVRTVDLHIDQQFTITTANGRNVITVKEGKIAVTEASCPDHYCMDRGFCSGGTEIVCLPNRLVIHFLGEQEIDGVVG